jgi:hypothetical protein
VHDSESYYQALRRAIAQQRAQFALLPLDDPRRDVLYRNLLWCYHEAFTLLYRRIEALREQRRARITAS